MTIAGRVARIVTALAALLLPAVTPSLALTLAEGGQARVEIRVGTPTAPADRTAARELAHYLSLSTGARFEIVGPEVERNGRPQLLVGWTDAARRSDLPPSSLGLEEWVIRSESGDLLLYGGSPRGTLYAVYQFLEEQVGVRWWTPYEEHVPRHRRLRVGSLDQRGKPVFGYRDVFGLEGPVAFRARHRLNGQFSRLGPDHGGSERYGLPRHVHTFFDYVPPEEFFETRPDLFSELAGLRIARQAQLCLSRPDLLPLVRERLVAYIEASRLEARKRGESPPRIFSFSANDWGGSCTCELCRASVDRHGTAAAPLVEFLNKLADAIRPDYPDLLLDTLAYMETLPAPTGLRLRDNVVVRLSVLQCRDFLRPIGDPEQHELLQTIEGWLGVTPHLRIWGYAVNYGPHGDLPLPNLSVLADDLAAYRRLGIEGVFVQLDYPLDSDMRALKRWVLLKLLENPDRDLHKLVVQFTRGYYGKAAGAIRQYLEALESGAAQSQSRIGFEARWEDYTYLETALLLRAHRYFDAAETAVKDDPIRLRRVRRARLSLDRATLWRWNETFGADGSTSDTDGAHPPDLGELIRRYRETWYAQIGLHLPAAGRGAARAEVEREIAFHEARLSD